MASSSTHAPKLARGAIVVYESHSHGSQAKTIVFQYNPEQLSRSLEKHEPESTRGNAKEDVLRAAGPPKETLKLKVVLNTADQLEQPERNRSVAENGLHPALATLEMLLYPTRCQVLQNEALAS